MTSYQEPTREKPDHIILLGIVGSTAQGLAHEASDIDLMGVFVEPTEAFLGLSGVPRERQCWRPKGAQDIAVHEVGKFCSKVIGGNPTFTELLWLPPDLYETIDPIGSDLIRIRSEMLSAKPVHDSYFGYATSQLKGLREKGLSKARINKQARHMHRLLEQGFHVWSTGEIQVRTKDPDVTRAFGNLVAAGDLDLADREMAKYERMFKDTKTVLPEQPNRKAVDTWLRNTRRALLER